MAVGVLQAADGLQLRGADDGAAGSGLLPVEQRGGGAVLRVRFVQGGGAGGRAAELAQALRTQHRDGGGAHRNLLHRLLRLPERQTRRHRLPLRP